MVSLGGSIIIPESNDDVFLTQLSSLLKKLSEKCQIFVVGGGGKIARYYIKTGRKLQASESDLDEMGIAVTRLNARLLQLALGDLAVESIPHTTEEAAALGRRGKGGVMGGTTPGHTTDCVSACLARDAKADRLVNATSVDGVYSDDPKQVKDAVRYSHLTFEQFQSMMTAGAHGAGRSGVFDPLGCEVLMKIRTPVLVVDGRDLMSGEPSRKAIRGTIVGD